MFPTGLVWTCAVTINAYDYISYRAGKAASRPPKLVDRVAASRHAELLCAPDRQGAADDLDREYDHLLPDPPLAW